MKQHLLPVWGYSRFSAAARDFGLPFVGREVTGWWDGPPFHYGHCLISYVHWKKPYQFPKDSYIFGDSGGFSLRSPTMNLKIDPVDVLRWQAGLCTVGCVLDLPPRGVKQRLWERGLEVTLEHTRRALPTYLKMREAGHPFRWWGVLHGNNEEEVRAYHKAVSAVYPFTDDGEGWAIRPEPQVNIDGVARSLRILNHLGIKKAHFLAATSQDVIAVLLALGPLAGMEVLTYDSAYAVKSGFNRHIFRPQPDGLTFNIQSEEGADQTGRYWLLEQCPCAVCAHMRARVPDVPKAQKELHDPKFGGWWSTWLQFHDLHIQQQLTQAQADYAEKDPDGLLRLMLKPADYAAVHRIFESDGHERRSIVPTGNSHSLLDLIPREEQS